MMGNVSCTNWYLACLDHVFTAGWWLRSDLLFLLSLPPSKTSETYQIMHMQSLTCENLPIAAEWKSQHKKRRDSTGWDLTSYHVFVCVKSQTKKNPLLRSTKEKAQRHRKSEASVKGFILPWCFRPWWSTSAIQSPWDLTIETWVIPYGKESRGVFDMTVHL